VLRAGAAPILIPVTQDRMAVKSILDLCDGLILTGGEDVSPLLYGEDPVKKIGTLSRLRDDYDLLLFNLALERKIPVFGICRGMQLINVALGGSLHQHTDDLPQFTIRHVQQASRHEVTHRVTVVPSSRLHPVLGDSVAVNSWHHQAIKDLALGLTAVASSSDGLIEAVESINESLPPIIGVQWHPEELSQAIPEMADLFFLFVEICGENK
ncbi:MAG TPA: gamma-glutamyl-gamma-aminobutyrate hydrolase family protein, partial [Clostridia bacterium]|nr:gamma-glutamyl-gamma-aminobutyrate hydrolase family protein [Clostridia bacterium]